jgi:hypothetical protein
MRCLSFAPDNIPILREWLALPLVRLGSIHVGDEGFNAVFHPIAIRLLDRCALRLFQAPPRGECCFPLALRYDFTSIKLSMGLSPSSRRPCSADTRNPPAGAERVWGSARMIRA